mgnify:CR=1 FL=1
MFLCFKGGDAVLGQHLVNHAGNASYISPRIQNEIIGLCGNTVRESIVNDIRQARFFSIMIDEVADLSRIEQLSLVLRFVDKKNRKFKL